MIVDPLMRGIVRPTWDERHMLVAIDAATRSTCLIRAVGANLVRGNRTVASGYNGAPSGTKSCLDLGYCYYQKMAWDDSKKGHGEYVVLKEIYKPFCIATHAEANTSAQCSEMGIAAAGATLYITNFPCPGCASDHVIANRLAEVKVWKAYLNNPLISADEEAESRRRLGEARIPISFVNLSDERIVELSKLRLMVGSRTDYKLGG